MSSPTSRTLVAGIGNIFLGDDGFGVEVVQRLDPDRLRDDVDVADYGIRGVHLAYELLDGRYDTLVLVDAVPLGDEPPGTVVVIDASGRAGAVPAGSVDAHSMSPDVVLGALHGLGGDIERVLVVGCQPAVIDERMELSASVAAAVPVAVERLVELLGTPSSRDPSAPERRNQWTPSKC
jgi:hydrogenase maturation protease